MQIHFGGGEARTRGGPQPILLTARDPYQQKTLCSVHVSSDVRNLLSNVEVKLISYYRTLTLLYAYTVLRRWDRTNQLVNSTI
jgi:hypothetical protein